MLNDGIHGKSKQMISLHQTKDRVYLVLSSALKIQLSSLSMQVEQCVCCSLSVTVKSFTSHWSRFQSNCHCDFYGKVTRGGGSSTNMSHRHHIKLKCMSEKGWGSQHPFSSSTAHLIKSPFSDRDLWRSPEQQIPDPPWVSRVNKSRGAAHTDIAEPVGHAAPTSTPVNEHLPGSNEHVTLVWPLNKVLF